MMFVRLSKIPISDTFNGLVGMDFVDYGRYATFFTHSGRFSAIILWEQRERKRDRKKWSGGRDSELAIGVWGARNYRGR